MKAKYHLGMSLGFNSSAALVDNKGRLVRAVSEERLTREKNTKRIPVHAILLVVRGNSGVSNVLNYSHYDILDKEYFAKYEPEWLYDDNMSAEQNLLSFINMRCHTSFIQARRVDHHTAHAYSIFPYYKVPRNSYIIVSDGYGDGLSYSERHVKDIKKPISSVSLRDSVALVYQFITGSLGLKMHQHEGKVTGLAARGDYTIALKLMKKLYLNFSASEHFWSYKGHSFFDLQRDIFEFCKDWLNKEPSKVVIDADDSRITSLCLMAQLFIEKETLRLLSTINDTHKHHLFLAGGLFANVRLNSLIAKRTSFKTVNVAPCMGDEGTAIGAALSLFEPKKIPAGHFGNVYSGLSMKDPCSLAINFVVDEECHHTTFLYEKDLIDEMAKILANGGIVHYRGGLSEFGPRALCHSSTFYQPSDPEGTKLLNKTLGRSEYMPYAPIVLDKDVDKLFYRDKKLDKTNQYMTAVLKCKVDTEQYAGAIHCDGTARPQVLYNHSSFAYRLLKKYKQLTGLAMLINTSWNIHGNPTVASSTDSLMTWRESGFCGDALVHDKTIYRQRRPVWER